MAINQNHLFEDLNGIKCSIVEKNASKERTDFLKRILEYNRYTVIIVPSPPAPPPKAAPAAPPAPAASSAAPSAPAPSAPTASTPDPAPVPASTIPAASVVPAAEPVPAPIAPPPPETFTIGVTDTVFNPTNAIFGRLLKAPGGHTVTLAYWQQKESTPDDEVPYFDAKY